MTMEKYAIYVRRPSSNRRWTKQLYKLVHAETKHELHEISLELKQTLENKDELMDFLRNSIAEISIVNYPNSDRFYVEPRYIYRYFDIILTVTEYKLIIQVYNKYNTIRFKGRWKTALTFKSTYNIVKEYSDKILRRFCTTKE